MKSIQGTAQRKAKELGQIIYICARDAGYVVTDKIEDGDTPLWRVYPSGRMDRYFPADAEAEAVLLRLDSPRLPQVEG